MLDRRGMLLLGCLGVAASFVAEALPPTHLQGGAATVPAVAAAALPGQSSSGTRLDHQVVLHGPAVHGAAFNYPVSLGGQITNCYGNHGSQSAWADMHVLHSSCHSKRPWAAEARPSIGAEGTDSGFGSGTSLDLTTGTLFITSFMGSSATCQATPLPPTVDQVAAGTRSHDGNCASFIAALEAAAEATLLFSRNLPRVATSMGSCSSSQVAERPELADAVHYLDQLKIALAERADAFIAAARAARASNPDLKLPPPRDDSGVLGQAPPAPKLPDLARKLRPPFTPC